jgi:hypothetical protein
LHLLQATPMGGGGDGDDTHPLVVGDHGDQVCVRGASRRGSRSAGAYASPAAIAQKRRAWGPQYLLPKQPR